MSVVYAGTHRNGSRVAIKILRRDAAMDAELRARFSKESTIGNRVAHPGAVVGLDDGTTDDGLPYLVLERVEGESVASRLTILAATARMPVGLPIQEAVRITDAVLDVLANAHERGIVHRDIKPENVMCVPGGGIKLLDFGIAREETLGNQTISGMALGTPAFMPPEQARGRWDQVDARSDLFSVGALLFTMATGRFLRHGGTSAEVLVAAMGEVPSMQLIAPELPQTLMAFLDRALAAVPAARFSNAREMQHALRDLFTFAAHSTFVGHASSSKRPAPAAPQHGRAAGLTTYQLPLGSPHVRWFALGVGAVGLMVVTMIGAALATRSSGGSQQVQPIASSTSVGSALFAPPRPTETSLGFPSTPSSTAVRLDPAPVRKDDESVRAAAAPRDEAITPPPVAAHPDDPAASSALAPSVAAAPNAAAIGTANANANRAHAMTKVSSATVPAGAPSPRKAADPASKTTAPPHTSSPLDGRF